MKRWSVHVQVSATQLVGYSVTVSADSRTAAEAAAKAIVRNGDMLPTLVEPVRKQLLTSNAIEHDGEVLGA